MQQSSKNERFTQGCWKEWKDKIVKQKLKCWSHETPCGVLLFLFPEYLNLESPRCNFMHFWQKFYIILTFKNSFRTARERSLLWLWCPWFTLGNSGVIATGHCLNVMAKALVMFMIMISKFTVRFFTYSVNGIKWTTIITTCTTKNTSKFYV